MYCTFAVTAFSLCLIVISGCTTVLKADAETVIEPPPLATTVSLPGRPNGDIFYSLPTSGGGLASPPHLEYTDEEPISGDRSFLMPETMRMVIYGRQPGVFTDIDWQEAYLNDRSLHQHWFRSANFAIEKFKNINSAFALQLRPRAATTAVYAPEHPHLQIQPGREMAAIELRGGASSAEFNPLADHGEVLTKVELVENGGPCMKVVLDAPFNPEAVLILSAPADAIIQFKTVLFANRVSMSASSANLVQMDPEGPTDAWESECVANEEDAEETTINLSAVVDATSRQGQELLNLIDSSEGRAWLALVITPPYSLGSASYDAERERLSLDDLQFNRAPGAILLDNIEINAGAKR